MTNWRRSQHRHNRDLYEVLDRAQYPDWAITALFYAVLQLVDAALEEELGVRPSNHETRRAYVARCTVTRRIAAEYGQLKWLSEMARYRKHYTQLVDRVADAEVLFASICRQLPGGSP